jgi:hypothetical protein
MNMSTEDKSSERGSMEQRDPKLLSAVERFHAKRFTDQRRTKADKKAVLKVGSSKK